MTFDRDQRPSVPGRQEVLLDPGIRRLPVNPSVYAKAPADYPNPFKDPSLGARVKFDVEASEKRTNVVDALYDQTFDINVRGTFNTGVLMAGSPEDTVEFRLVRFTVVFRPALVPMLLSIDRMNSSFGKFTL